MKLFLATILNLLFCLSSFSQVITPDEKNYPAGSWYCFRNTAYIDGSPLKSSLRISADTKYWLWVNGSLEISEGGLKRGPNSLDSYCDVIESLSNLKKGNNSFVILVWYFGKDGYSHRNSPTPGISFDLSVNGKPVSCSDKWSYIVHPSYYIPEGKSPNYRLAESNIGFDASKDVDILADSCAGLNWKRAREISLSDAGWNQLVDRPIPFWKDFGLKHYDRIETRGDSLICYLPYNAQITPFIRMHASSGRRIKISTDNYLGGSVPNVFSEYISKDGDQSYECKGWMNGHSVIYTIPSGVEVLDLMYRESGYDTDFSGSFICDDQFLNNLWNKSQRTLYITMRDTYMDCPDRERAQWWGDVVNELGEAFYSLDYKSHLLARKGIYELIGWQRSDSTIYSPVPSGNYDAELPMQMLASVGYYGFWTYYMGSGDYHTIKDVYPGVRKYIHKWQTDSCGLVIPRKGGWTWGDWGDNKDMTLLFNQWYIIALQGYEELSRLLGYESEASWCKDRISSLRKSFHNSYWNGSYYVSPFYKGEPDDRAQALAIISGTLSAEYYPVIRPFFKKYSHASPYMEKYVLEALCKMGYYDDALARIKIRYREMVESPLTTLWEGWGIGEKGFGGGTYNHAWSGGPLTILSQYISGIETLKPAFQEFSVNPHPSTLNHIHTVVPLSDDRKISMEFNRRNHEAVMTLEVPYGTKAHLSILDGYEKWTVNGKLVKGNKKILKAGKWKIKYYSY